MRVRSLWVLVLVASLTAAAAPDTNVEARVKAIRGLYATVNAKASTPRYFCAGQQVDAAGLEDERCYESARVFTIDGKIRKAILGFWTPSGDWSSEVELYFDEQGRIAFRFERLGTFYGGNEELPGPFQVETRTYYSVDGQVIRERVAAKQQTTGKVVTPDTVYRQATPRLLTVAELKPYTTPDADAGAK